MNLFTEDLVFLDGLLQIRNGHEVIPLQLVYLELFFVVLFEQFLEIILLLVVHALCLLSLKQSRLQKHELLAMVFILMSETIYDAIKVYMRTHLFFVGCLFRAN